ncbi:hypothetical protein [Ruegeria sp. B32]|uniref:hypothetical protein n=1 Tax=Ruegeria sp. B32 TaxID=2867020 RepID=UPI0021A64E22|nr:hypothetical protein [Ruegeria sp. B32]UWR06554.1 hypothetical protein K3752_12995 [Ruegeria sp. B32]
MTISSHSEYMAAQRRLRSLRGTERADLAQEITAWKDAAARSRSVNSGAALAEAGRKLGCAKLVQIGMSNPHGLQPRANRKAGWSDYVT